MTSVQTSSGKCNQGFHAPSHGIPRLVPCSPEPHTGQRCTWPPKENRLRGLVTGRHSMPGLGILWGDCRWRFFERQTESKTPGASWPLTVPWVPLQCENFHKGCQPSQLSSQENSSGKHDFDETSFISRLFVKIDVSSQV